MIQNLMDPYEIKARLFPSLFTLSPLMLSAYLWYPSLLSLEQVGVNLLVTLCILFLLSKLSRELGYKKEKELLNKWGGFPTTILLRHQDSTIDAATKARYHNFLKENVRNVEIPTLIQEQKKPTYYDEQYNSAVNWLRENTRDQAKYTLLHRNNANYGFARNSLGLKKVGLCISTLSLFLNIVGSYQKYGFELPQVPIQIWTSISLCLVIMLIWFLFVNEKWVRNMAYSYAESLLATCEKTLG